MEKIIELNKVRKNKSPVVLIILAVLAVAVLGVGIYFIVKSGYDKNPSRGTYVMAKVPMKSSY